MNSIDSINIPMELNKNSVKLLEETKTDAKNAALNWANFFKMYDEECKSENARINTIQAKLELTSAIKNIYLMDIKLKKAKSL